MFMVMMLTFGLICLLIPAKIQKLLIWLSEFDGGFEKVATNYIRSPLYIWHLRFCGLIALLMGIVQIPGCAP